MCKHILVLLSPFVLSLLLKCANEISEQNRLVKYLNQPAPGTSPELFSADNLPSNIRDVAFTPDGKEFYFTHIDGGKYEIMYSSQNSGKWSRPSVAPFSGIYNDFEPCISADGKKFYFASMRPSAGKEDMKNDIDIWIMHRTKNGWSKPQILDESINTNCMEYYPSVTKDKTLYFGRNDLELTRGDIYRSHYIDKKYSNPIKLPENVNLPSTSFNAYIASDESYIIFSTYVQDGLLFHSDLYISFRDRNGRWVESQNMGEAINSKFNELSPCVSYDGKYLFFTSTRLDSTGTNKNHDIFWVKADIIDRCKINI